MLTVEYFETLRYAMRNGRARTFAIERLENSFERISINQKCTQDIVATLNGLLLDQDLKAFEEAVSKFRSTWRAHLARVYFHDYEETRWKFFRKFVVEAIDDGAQLGSALDVGCGRGCLTARLAQENLVSAITGVDAVAFDGEWRERVSAVRTGLRFEHVGVAGFEQWLAQQTGFDTVFLSYVLHHSEDYWAARTLHAVVNRLRRGGRVIVLEDSFGDGTPMDDPFELSGRWSQLSKVDGPYPVSPAFDVQVILDFVAVQLLAQFDEVAMPCNYRRMEEWTVLFEAVGAQVQRSRFIGFPYDRDIDVPQAVFILTAES